ncbi:aspartate/glutamate racemase family protein [Parasulfitobacter algicola]|uniref:Aspartate/glutamate racemase family protein n=1 Tax=Parasulfitobacter algicola TaxID=2614809 RepID=A0ABX2IVD3_9RHOB|nr:aspartate/glutamate racemase family protein [Sulfitobacter algicola]NSX56877.1 aspartate/glutamate racemase family protein [Sulfitobacter algicola]
MHIGLIGGIGPAATTYYYQLLLEEMGEQNLTISHASLKSLSGNVMAGNRDAQAAIFANHVDILKGAGADFAAVTSVAGHFCIEELAARSSLPLVSVLDSLKTYFSENSLKRIGILGNRVAMQSHLFGMIDTVNFVTPEAETLDKVGEAYMQMAKRGRCEDHERQLFIKAGQDMVDHSGADAVLLGGTDLFLAFDGGKASYPVVDAARVHVAELIKADRGPF